MKMPVAVTTEKFSDRTRSLLSLVNLHYAGVGALALLNLFLLVQMYVAWSAQSRSGPEAVAQQEVALKTAEVQVRPLQGLDSKIASATSDADRFYERRLPYAYSQVAAELGSLAKRDSVRLVRVQYAPNAVAEAGPADPQRELTEVKLDANLSGDYRGLVQFVNSLERDRLFFLIGGATLTGQQSGTVGLRLRLTTYLRPARTAELASAPAANEPPPLVSTTGGLVR
jgi:hypothetical protein